MGEQVKEVVENPEGVLATIQEYGVEFIFEKGPLLLLAAATLIIGSWLIKLINRAMARAMERSRLDVSLRGFLMSFTKVLLWLILIISVASTLGVETTSFVAVLGAAGLAVGLALQGSLSNFAGGVLILIFKPFRVGDIIETQGITGRVTRIDILHTLLLTFDNREVIMPNGPVANSNTINNTSQSIRRVDLSVGISYDSDIKKAREVVLAVLEKDSRILKDPAPVVKLTGLGDSSLNLTVRPWTNTPDYWEVYWDNLEAIKEGLDKAGIVIPFPQRDVHIFNK